MDSRDLQDFAHALADRAAEETLPRFRVSTAIDNKHSTGFDPVTEGDRAAETAIREMIEARFPGHGVVGEEFPEKPGDGSGWRWVLDPIDGTRAYICGVPVWTTLIALERNGAPVLGVIDQPFLRERWLGSRPGAGEAALEIRGAPAGAPTADRLGDARMMVTDMRAGEHFSAEEAAAVARLASKVRVVRQGLDGYGFGLVASGQMDLVVEAGLSWHDIAAVIPVIEAAGGAVTDWRGRPLAPGASGYRVVAAAGESLAEEARQALGI